MTARNDRSNVSPRKNGNSSNFHKHTSPFQLARRIWLAPSDAKVAGEMHRLPIKEREKVWADLSGNEKASTFKAQVVEDSITISTAVEGCRKEIQRIQNKEGYLLAQQQAPDYVNDRSFHLMFLRACDYDEKKAAQLIFDHMERKRELFGEGSTGRDIVTNDLSTSEKELLRSGSLSILHDRDSAGRAVLLSNFCNLNKSQKRESLVSDPILWESRPSSYDNTRSLTLFCIHKSHGLSST